MSAAEASEVNEYPDAAAGQGAAPVPLMDVADVPFGQRLRTAREARGWTHADVAARLRLSTQLIGRLESDHYAGLTDGVFLRGYLGSYARLVGIPVEAANRIAAAHTQTAPLVATGTISRSRFLFERYSVSATYLVLTAIIVVPAVWLATHGGLEQNLARTTPLDPPAQIAAATPRRDMQATIAEKQTSPVADSSIADSSAVAPRAPAPVDQPPIIASMAPFTSAAPLVQAASATTGPVASAAIGSGAHTLNLTLNEQSWVEITAADGHKLEYGMLAAHSEHTYRSDGPVSVKLGNAQGAQMRVDGVVFNLAPYQRSNVASIKLFASTGAADGGVDQ